MDILKGGHGKGGETFFRAASNHGPGIAPTNRLPGLSYAITTCGTGGNGGPIWSLRSRYDRDEGRGCIDHRHSWEVRADTIRSPLEEDLELLMVCRQATYPTANVYANVVSILFCNLQARLGQCLFGSGYSEVFEWVGMADCFPIHVGGGIEIFDLGTEMNAELARIIACNRSDARFPLAQRLPC